jgi:glycerol-3-phosphate acyltransferase PlsX
VNHRPIVVDAMGGDFGPSVVVEGAVRAFHELGISSTIVGVESEIHSCLRTLGVEAVASTAPGISIQNATEVITMEDSPSSAIRGKVDSSIRVAFELVRKGEGSAVVSPGNTGAVMAAGLYVSGTLPGIARPAIATLIPRVGDMQPTVLLDSGANTDCHAHQLVQFALMGTFYAKAINLYDNPRVALLSNGTEPSKGNDITRAAYAALSELSILNFIGYVEGRGLGKDIADVVVCDGFIGNVTLKTMEGAVELILDSLRFYTSQSLFRWKLGMMLAKPMFKLLFKEKLDPSSHGGAPLLGLRDVAVICHGSSNARAIMNAIRVAKKSVEGNLVEKIGAALTHLDEAGESFNEALFDRIGKRFEKKKGVVK